MKEFFEIVESSAEIANWSEFDKIQIMVLKLTEVAKHFIAVTQNYRIQAFHGRTLRFRDVKSDQYHFMQLQTAKQKKDETVQKFLDRCRSLAMKTDPKVQDLLLQKFHYDQA